MDFDKDIGIRAKAAEISARMVGMEVLAGRDIVLKPDPLRYARYIESYIRNDLFTKWP